MWSYNFVMGKGHASHCCRFAGRTWRCNRYVKLPTLLC